MISQEYAIMKPLIFRFACDFKKETFKFDIKFRCARIIHSKILRIIMFFKYETTIIPKFQTKIYLDQNLNIFYL